MNLLIKIDPKTGKATVFENMQAAMDWLAKEMKVKDTTARCYISAALQKRQTFTDHVWLQVPSDIWHLMRPQIVERAALKHFMTTFEWGNLPLERLYKLKVELTGLINVADRKRKEAA